jgi:hypothetical protein
MAFSRSRKTSEGLTQALRLLHATRRKPTEADRPPLSILQGRRPVRKIDGQLDIYGNEDGDAA